LSREAPPASIAEPMPANEHRPVLGARHPVHSTPYSVPGAQYSGPRPQASLGGTSVVGLLEGVVEHLVPGASHGALGTFQAEPFRQPPIRPECRRTGLFHDLALQQVVGWHPQVQATVPTSFLIGSHVKKVLGPSPRKMHKLVDTFPRLLVGWQLNF